MTKSRRRVLLTTALLSALLTLSAPAPSARVPQSQDAARKERPPVVIQYIGDSTR